MSPRHFLRRSNVMGWTAGLAVAAMLCVSPAIRAADGDAPGATKPTGEMAKAEQPKVAIVDFRTTAKDDAMVTAVQQQLMRDLQLAGFEPVASKTDDPSFAKVNAAARDANARYAVSGSVQTVGNSVQILGQVSDVGQEMYAPVKASGSADDFFSVQDEFVTKVKSALASARAGGAKAAAAADQRPVAPTSIPQAQTSYWAGYTNVNAPQVIYAGSPPTPPPPPLYGGYQHPYLGGGGYFDSGPIFDGPVFPLPVPLGTVRTEHLGKLGVSIIPRPPGLSHVGFKAAASFQPAAQGPTPIPAFNQPIQKYKNPFSKFASPVGQPQRAAPPNLRPGTDGSN